MLTLRRADCLIRHRNLRCKERFIALLPVMILIAPAVIVAASYETQQRPRYDNTYKYVTLHFIL